MRCEHCGVALSPQGGRGRRRRWCTPECRRADPRVRARHAEHERARKARDRGTRPENGGGCVVCFAPLTGAQTRYCSPPCSILAAQVALTFEQRAEQRRKHAAKRAAFMAEYRQRPEYKARRAERERESNRLRGRLPPEVVRARHRRRAAHWKLRRAARGTSGGGVVWCQGRCARCGGAFAGKGSRTNVPLYCSDRCGDAAARDRRRAREAGAKITPGRRWRVFERDGWVCRICGDPVNREAKVPALDAPVVDHRVPLAAGGEHCEDNWQCAHFYCNSVKQDQVGIEFAA